MAEEPRPGLIVGGRYELIEICGRGGMADVWRGRVRGDWGFVRDVAVKQMHQNLAAQPPYVAMFVEEARVGSSLQSPNVAEVHDFVHDRGNYYMILEWIDGVDLGTWIRWHVGRNEQTRWELVAAVAVGILRGARRRARTNDARRLVAAGRSPRRVSSQRAADESRHGEADRFRSRARARSIARDDRARHRQRQDVVSRARDRCRQSMRFGMFDPALKKYCAKVAAMPATR